MRSLLSLAVLVTAYLSPSVTALPEPAIAERDIFSSIQNAVSNILGASTATSTTSIGRTVTTTMLTTTATTKPKGTSIVLGPPQSAIATSTANTSTKDDGDSTSSSLTGTATSTSSDTSTTTDTNSSTTTSATSSPSSASTTFHTSTSSTPTSADATSELNGATASSTAFPSSSSSNNGSNGISRAGVAVAIVVALFVFALATFLVLRYRSKIRAWWLARKEKRRQDRSYREAIDGPEAIPRSNGSALRQRALGGGDDDRNSRYGGTRRSVLASFFAPRTVKVGGGKEIKRKPVAWGVPSGGTNHPRRDDRVGVTEKVPLTEMAAPMGQMEAGVTVGMTAKAKLVNVSSNRQQVPNHGSAPLSLSPPPPLPPKVTTPEARKDTDMV